MASMLLLLLKPLESMGDVYQNWIAWKSESALFSTATGLSKQSKDVQAATLIMTTREEANWVFYAFKFTDDKKQDLDKLIEKFRPTTNQ